MYISTFNTTLLHQVIQDKLLDLNERRASSNVIDFKQKNKSNCRRTFSKFYRQHTNLASKYNVGLNQETASAGTVLSVLIYFIICFICFVQIRCKHCCLALWEEKAGWLRLFPWFAKCLLSVVVSLLVRLVSMPGFVLWWLFFLDTAITFSR